VRAGKAAKALDVAEKVTDSGGPVKLFHGTDIDSARSLLRGTPLDAATAAANKIDGPPGFFLATHADDAAYFATRRGDGTILEYTFSPAAVRQLGGMPATPIGALGRFGSFIGGEVVVGPGAFSTFNRLRQTGEICVSPHQW
jgi:hypothetical protein